MEHHTKTKGDAGVGQVIACLMSNGIVPALPISEHLPFDLIAVSQETNQLSRVSVKYRTANKSGAIEVQFASAWADQHGSHRRKHAKDAYDATAVYCPDTGKCYFVRSALCYHFLGNYDGDKKHVEIAPMV